MNRLEKMEILKEFCIVPRSASEMMDVVGALAASTFRRDYLIPMQKDGIIVRVGTGRSTKYLRIKSERE